jgi:hypothetical protein
MYISIPADSLNDCKVTCLGPTTMAGGLYKQMQQLHCWTVVQSVDIVMKFKKAITIFHKLYFTVLIKYMEVWV